MQWESSLCSTKKDLVSSSWDCTGYPALIVKLNQVRERSDCVSAKALEETLRHTRANALNGDETWLCWQ